MRPKTMLYAALVAFQAVVLVGTAVAEDTRLRSGDEVVLKTVPIDPRDLLRGDYVALAYEISTPNAAGFEVGETVFVRLEEHGGVWDAATVGGRYPPDWDTVIRGEVVEASPLRVEYGIEAYFVPEGRGVEIETADEVLAVVSLGDDGRARIRHLIVDGRRWD